MVASVLPQQPFLQLHNGCVIKDGTDLAKTVLIGG